MLGYNLNYYSGDYKAITGTAPFPNASPVLNAVNAYRPLYNGNIGSMAVSIKHFNQPYLYNYKYDQLNRLRAMDTYSGLNESTNAWNTLTGLMKYNERVTYDGNGNIQQYNRYYDAEYAPMDSLTYHYIAGTNKLSSVTDLSEGYINSNRKIKNQPANNYAYDEIGNLVKDSSENIPSNGIKWNVYGKITEINHSVGDVLYDTKKITYTYDASGNRIGKKVVKFESPVVYYTWYVRDASGNILHIYTANKDTSGSVGLNDFDLILSEDHIYGSNRLGVFNRGDYAEENWPGSVYYSTRGRRFYEVSNHLGNVLTTISDKKIGHDNGSGVFDYYDADIVNATDFYSFGMVSRYNYNGSLNLNYRYSFNGKENDGDVKGEGNQIDYGMRVYDPRLGRFLSVDPLMHEYPWNSSYAYAENEPISNVDLDGLEKDKRTGFMSLVGQGIKQGAHEFTSEIKQTSKAVFSNQTYRDIWKSTVNFSNTAVKNPTQALHKFNTGAYDLSIAFSNYIQDNTTVPVLWTINIPNKSKEENLRELGYGLWKGAESYALMKIPEILEERPVIQMKSSPDRIFNHFTNREGIAGITGVNTKLLDNLAVGESLTVNTINFGKGKNAFLANAPGDIFVTDIGTKVTTGQLNNVGVFADKQTFAISFSEEGAFNQGVKIKGANPERGIYTIPANTSLKGSFKITRVKK